MFTVRMLAAMGFLVGACNSESVSQSSQSDLGVDSGGADANSIDATDSGPIDGGNPDVGCFCCSASQGALSAGGIGDIEDCDWCPGTSACIQRMGRYVCVTSVPNGGVVRAGSPNCTPP